MLVSCLAVSLVLGHKNLHFEHEREVRFVRSRLLQELAPPEGAGYRSITTQGKPKNIFVLPLRNYPEFGISAGIADLLDHIIIGPSNEQEKIAQEVRRLLDGNGLARVQVRRSEIPYRANR